MPIGTFSNYWAPSPICISEPTQSDVIASSVSQSKLDWSLQISENMLGCCPMCPPWFHHELIEGVDSITDVWPSVDQIHQRSYGLPIQGRISFIIFGRINFLLVGNHWSSHGSTVLHLKPLHKFCSIPSLIKEDFTFLLPNFQP